VALTQVALTQVALTQVALTQVALTQVAGADAPDQRHLRLREGLLDSRSPAGHLVRVDTPVWVGLHNVRPAAVVHFTADNQRNHRGD
jgi:hypothetical protein